MYNNHVYTVECCKGKKSFPSGMQSFELRAFLCYLIAVLAIFHNNTLHMCIPFSLYMRLCMLCSFASISMGSTYILSGSLCIITNIRTAVKKINGIVLKNKNHAMIPINI